MLVRQSAKARQIVELSKRLVEACAALAGARQVRTAPRDRTLVGWSAPPRHAKRASRALIPNFKMCGGKLTAVLAHRVTSLKSLRPLIVQGTAKQAKYEKAGDAMVVMAPAVAGSQKKRRRTRYITLPQANNLAAASEFARTIGCPLNVSIDICWLMFSGYAEDSKRLAKCQQRLSKWFVRRNFQLSWDLGPRNRRERSVTQPHTGACPTLAYGGWGISNCVRKVVRARRGALTREGYPD